MILVRPYSFTPNPMTAADNLFQAIDTTRTSHELAYAAYREVTGLAETLQDHGVGVHVFDDVGPDLPDSVFPNNWLSTHDDGHIALYPMYSPNRRGERRSDVIDRLRERYVVSEVTDYSEMEAGGHFLEGTGAMVLDHQEAVAYIARSNRAHDHAISRICADLGYEPVVFGTADRQGTPIYHTNVMMSVATRYALIGLTTITDTAERRTVTARLERSGRDLIDLSHDQIENFAGNVIELRGADGLVLALSQRAYDSLRPGQRAQIEQHVELLPVAVPTIELAGGSVRCMIAGVHLRPRHRGRDSATNGLRHECVSSVTYT